MEQKRKYSSAQLGHELGNDGNADKENKRQLVVLEDKHKNMRESKGKYVVEKYAVVSS